MSHFKGKATLKYDVSKELLEHLYIKEGLSTKEVAKKLGISYVPRVKRYLKRFNIPRRPPDKRWYKDLIKEKDLRSMYNEQGLTTYEIAGKYGVSAETIRRYLREFNIPIRKPHDYHRSGWKRPDISNRITLNCKVCGKEFSVRACRKDTAKYCSTGCMYKDDDFVRAVIRGNSRRPTRPENKFINLVKKKGLPYKYNGNKGDVIIGGKVPDFVHNSEKVVVEVLGRVFHDPNYPSPFTTRNPPEELISHYRAYGYKCVTLWDDELDDESYVLNKVNIP